MAYEYNSNQKRKSWKNGSNAFNNREEIKEVRAGDIAACIG
jgi:hypothetical protein